MPTAEITFSTWIVSTLPLPRSTVTVAPLASTFTPVTLAPVWIFMPCFSKALRAKAEISSSSTGSTRSITSTTVTAEPIVL